MTRIQEDVAVPQASATQKNDSQEGQNPPSQSFLKAAWTFRGDWNGGKVKPVESGVSGGVPFISIHLRAGTPMPMSNERAMKEARDLIRNLVYKSLHASDAYRRLLELRPQLLKAQADYSKRRAAVLSRESLRAELLAISPVPVELAHKLLKADEEVTELRRLCDKAQLVLDTITPLYQKANDTFLDLAQQIGYTVVQEANNNMIGELASDLLAAMGDERLTRLASVMHSRQMLYQVSGIHTAKDVVEQLLKDVN